jgi:hypothetical protein
MTTPTILLLGGKKGSGKDTAADVLTDHWGFRKFAFAGPIKEGIGREVFQLTDEQLHGAAKEEEDPVWGLTPRQILQKAGTDAFKPVFGKEIWAKSAVSKIEQSSHTLWVCSDLRFPVEIGVMERAFDNVAAINIDARERLGISLSWWKTMACHYAPGLTDYFGSQYHPSETALDSYSSWNAIITNNGTPGAFYEKIYCLGRHLHAHNYDPQCLNHLNTRKRLRST